MADSVERTPVTRLRQAVDVLTTLMGDQISRLKSAAVESRNIPPKPATDSTCAAIPETYRQQTRIPQIISALAQLLESPNAIEPFAHLLREIEPEFSASGSALLVSDERSSRLKVLAHTGNTVRISEHWSTVSRERQDPRNGGMSFELSDRQPGSSERLLSVELRRESKQCGLLLLQVPEELQLSAQQLDLLRTLSAALANLLHGTHRAQLSHRLALHDERATIARELHDSLAQSLSYLKIQASRLQSLLHGSQNLQLDRLEIDNIAEEMRANLNRAYRQLRELITTCRLTMNGKTIGQALLDSVEEFEKRSTMTFDLDNRLTDDMLTVDQEMQVLHIVREAMTNVVRHAQASFVKVSLHCPDHDEIVVSIADDGIGIEAPREGEQHYGLLIMQERAHKLGGNLRLEQNPSGGTHVLVCFSREPVL